MCASYEQCIGDNIYLVSVHCAVIYVFRQRFDYLNHVRNLSEDIWDNTDAESVDSQESMEIQVTDDNIRLRRPGKHFRNQVIKCH